MAIGDNIKKYRELRGLSVEQLANKMGIKKAGIYNWEANEYKPGQESLTKLATALEITVSELMDGKPTSEHKANDNKEKMENTEPQSLKDLIEKNDKYRLVPTIILDQYEILPKNEVKSRERILETLLQQAREISAAKQVIIDVKDQLITELEKEIAELRASTPSRVPMPAQQA